MCVYVCVYVRARACVCVCVQKEFVRLIQGSGVLVVLSPAWIEELYQQVLERNLLAEAGYWGWAEEQTAPPLVSMLRGNAADRPLRHTTSERGSENNFLFCSPQTSTVSGAAPPSEVS